MRRVALVVVLALGVAVFVHHATARDVPDRTAAERIVESRLDLARTTCTTPEDYQPGDREHWDYECSLGDSGGSVLVRFDGTRIVDSSTIA